MTTHNTPAPVWREELDELANGTTIQNQQGQIAYKQAGQWLTPGCSDPLSGSDFNDFDGAHIISHADDHTNALRAALHNTEKDRRTAQRRVDALEDILVQVAAFVVPGIDLDTHDAARRALEQIGAAITPHIPDTRATCPTCDGHGWTGNYPATKVCPTCREAGWIAPVIDLRHTLGGAA